jgi:hypothetical protein
MVTKPKTRTDKVLTKIRYHFRIIRFFELYYLNLESRVDSRWGFEPPRVMVETPAPPVWKEEMIKKRDFMLIKEYVEFKRHPLVGVFFVVDNNNHNCDKSRKGKI